jgi:membrane-bound serine protease (ClpP class)
MCVLGVEVYLVEHPATGQRRAVNAADYAVMVRGQQPELAERSQRSWLGWGKEGTDPARASVEVATEADREQWKLIRKVHDGQTLLTLSQAQAVAVGLARSDAIGGVGDLQRFLAAGSVFEVRQTWSEAIANWLTSPVVRGVLVMALLLGAYIELQSPGLGLPGAVALLALGALIGGPFMVGLAEIWHLILIAVGLVLLGVEVLLIPGFGFVGISGLLLMLAGLVLAAVPTTGRGPVPLPDPAMVERLWASVAWTMAGLAAGLVGLYWLTKYFGRIPVLNRLVLGTAQSLPAELQPVRGDKGVGEGQIAVGNLGQAVAQLRPTGRARFGQRIVDVVSLGEWIEPGRRVRVVEVAGNRVVVEAEK